MHAEGMRPQLFDMRNDPLELVDLGESPAHRDTIALMYERLARWARRQSQRTTISDAQIDAARGRSANRGITLGVFDECDLPAPLTQFYRGAPRADPHPISPIEEQPRARRTPD